MTPYDSRKRPRFQWDEYRTQVVCCLFRFFHEDSEVFGQIFSEFFKEHLLERGFPQRLIPYPDLQKQWNKLRRNNNAVWRYVHLETAFRTDREWKDILHIIKAIASRLNVILNEKHLEDDEAYRKRIANKRDHSTTLLSTEEAMNQVTKVLTTNSPMIDFRSPGRDWTPRQPTPESPSNVHPPTRSRFWPRDDEIRWQREQEVVQRSVSMSRSTNLLGSPSLNELAETEDHKESEESEEPAPCKGMLWGFPCLWCHKEGDSKSGNEQSMVMEGDIDGSSNGLIEDRLSAPLDMNDDLQPLDEQCSDAQVQEDSQITNSRTLSLLSKPESLPPVLYRWSNIHSQGINSPSRVVSGMFAFPGSIAFSPADLDEESFLGYVKSHLTKAPLSSPFVSAFKSPLAPIHRALRHGKKAKISIIDTSQMTTEIFKAAPLVVLTDTALNNWEGLGEYLIWREVPTFAIACTFKISSLETIARDHHEIGQFLQLDTIRKRSTCTRYLYSDLAANVPPSQDGYAAILDKMTDLLGLHGDIKDLVARDFKQAWTEKFRDLHYERPKSLTPTPSDTEHQQTPEFGLDPSAAQDFPIRRSRRMSGADSDRSWRPRRGDGDNDSGTSTSGSESSVGSEEAVECPRRDTPSDGYYSVDDESSVDWRRRSPLDGEDVEMTEEDWRVDHDEWPSDDGMPDHVPIHWSS